MGKLPISIKNKLNRLKNIIQNMQSLVVAYSGGVDSTLLLKISKDVLKNKVLAVIAQSETYPQREIRYAIKMARKLNVPFLLIETEELRNKNFVTNSRDRCYWCKRELFLKIHQIARKNKISFVADGSNYDDLSDFRPGFKAAEELNIRKPLIEVQLTKDEIRQISKRLRLPTWNKPSFACLASRFPYASRIDRNELIKINAIEEYIMKFGIRQVRVRHFGHIVKIDLLEEDFEKAIKHKEKILTYCKKIGYIFVVLDLEGYKTGSMNKLLEQNIRIR